MTLYKLATTFAEFRHRRWLYKDVAVRWFLIGRSDRESDDDRRPLIRGYDELLARQDVVSHRGIIETALDLYLDAAQRDVLLSSLERHGGCTHTIEACEPPIDILDADGRLQIISPGMLAVGGHDEIFTRHPHPDFPGIEDIAGYYDVSDCELLGPVEASIA